MVSRDCCVVFPHGAMGWSAVRDCGMSYVLYCEYTLGHTCFSEIVRVVYPGICHFKFCDRVFAQSRSFKRMIWYHKMQPNGWCKSIHGLTDIIGRTKKVKLLNFLFVQCLYHSNTTLFLTLF